MNIGIITFHNAKNYGAALQAYALCKFINSEYKEANAEVIDYKCKYLEDFYDPNKAYDKSIKGRIKRVLSKKVLQHRNEVFDNFVKKNIPLSQSCDTYSISQIKMYDQYISGSDMLWHWHTTNEGDFFDDVFFLGFVKDHNKKNSYAASFGTDSIDDKYLSYYERMLKSFHNISVREESGIEIVKSITGKSACCHVDPTLLFSSNEWRMIEKKPELKGYVLLYEVGNISNKMLAFAEKLANEKNKKLIILLSEYNPIKRRGIFGYSPEEFLGWFDNADYVITNSFHGTVFSILFHKQFVVEINSWIKNNRASELMKVLQLDERNLDICKDIDEKIHWDNVDSKLQYLRADAREYLASIVNGDD